MSFSFVEILAIISIVILGGCSVFGLVFSFCGMRKELKERGTKNVLVAVTSFLKRTFKFK